MRSTFRIIATGLTNRIAKQKLETEVKEAAKRLDILLLEQVDPLQELTLQTCQQLILTEFTLFPNLPQELRNAIWKACLPRGRRVCLDRLYPIVKTTPELKLLCPHEIYQIDSELRREGYIDLPITLSVCHESRAETLLHYVVIFRDIYNQIAENAEVIPSSGVPAARVDWDYLKPLCFDPTRDQLYVNNESFRRGERYAEWIRHMDCQLRAPFTLGRIHEIELVGLRWNRGYEHEMRLHVRGTPMPPYWANIYARFKQRKMETGDFAEGGLLANVMLFHGLRRLRLSPVEFFFLTKVPKPDDLWFAGKNSKVVFPKFRRLMKGFLEKHKRSFLDGKAPKLLYHKEFKTLKDRRRVAGLLFIGDDDVPTIIPYIWNLP